MITSENTHLAGDSLGALEQPDTYAQEQAKAVRVVKANTPRDDWPTILDALGLLPAQPQDQRCESRNWQIQRRCTLQAGHDERHRDGSGHRWG